MVGICQRTEQRQDRSSYKPYETKRVPPRARRRRHCVGGGAPNNFGRGGVPPVPKKIRRRRRGVGGQQLCFQKFPKKCPILKIFLMTFFNHQSKIAIKKSRRRRQQIVGGGGAARRAGAGL